MDAVALLSRGCPFVPASWTSSSIRLSPRRRRKERWCHKKGRCRKRANNNLFFMGRRRLRFHRSSRFSFVSCYNAPIDWVSVIRCAIRYPMRVRMGYTGRPAPASAQPAGPRRQREKSIWIIHCSRPIENIDHPKSSSSPPISSRVIYTISSFYALPISPLRFLYSIYFILSSILE